MNLQTEKTDATSTIEEISLQLKLYIQTIYELNMLKIVKKISLVCSSILIIAIFLFSVVLAIVFISAGAAIWLNGITNSPVYGFFIVSAFYILLSLTLYWSRNNRIKKILTNKVIHEILND